MIRGFSCLVEQHHAWLALLAAALCVFSFGVAATLLHHVDVTQPRRRSLWLFGVGVVIGGGAWATHFVAMLGYQPGFPLHFLPGPTLLSTVFGVAGAAGACIIADRFRSRGETSLAGRVMARGNIRLHFAMGMSRLKLSLSADHACR